MMSKQTESFKLDLAFVTSGSSVKSPVTPRASVNESMTSHNRKEPRRLHRSFFCFFSSFFGCFDRFFHSARDTFDIRHLDLLFDPLPFQTMKLMVAVFLVAFALGAPNQQGTWVSPAALNIPLFAGFRAQAKAEAEGKSPPQRTATMGARASSESRPIHLQLNPRED